jgi:hypothetical protein
MVGVEVSVGGAEVTVGGTGVAVGGNAVGTGVALGPQAVNITINKMIQFGKCTNLVLIAGLLMCVWKDCRYSIQLS